MNKRRREAFTLMEMMVVIGMLGVLVGVTFSGIGQAKTRARVAKANAEVRELVNAILAYEAAEDELEVTPERSKPMRRRSLLLGDGGPVYLNMKSRDGVFRDPWATYVSVGLKLNQVVREDVPTGPFRTATNMPDGNPLI